MFARQFRESEREILYAVFAQLAEENPLLADNKRATQMRLKLCSPQRRQLVNSAAATIQLDISNPSAARAPADWSGVKRARTRGEQLHERNLLFPRRSYFSGDFHLAFFPRLIKTLQARR